MKNTMKAVTVLSSAALLLATSACGGSSDDAGGTASADQLSVVYVPGLTGNPFYATVSCGASDEAAAQGVSFDTQGSPEFDVTKQTEIVNAVIASKPDAIMISITDPEAMVIPLTAAKDAGIDVIGIDGDLVDTSVMSTNIQSDGYAGGFQAGEAMAKLVGEEGAVMTIDNATGSIVSKARTDGFAAAVAQYPGMTDLGIQYSANEVDKAASFASTTATTNSELVGIFTAETNNTEGAITGLREAGKTGAVKVIGYDTSDPIVAALEDGSLDGTVVQYPYGEGKLGIQAAVALSKGETVERDQPVDAVLATPENVDSPEVQQYLYDIDCSESSASPAASQ